MKKYRVFFVSEYQTPSREIQADKFEISGSQWTVFLRSGGDIHRIRTDLIAEIADETNATA